MKLPPLVPPVLRSPKDPARKETEAPAGQVTPSIRCGTSPNTWDCANGTTCGATFGTCIMNLGPGGPPGV